MSLEDHLISRKDHRDYLKVREFLRVVEKSFNLQGRTVADLCCGSGLLGATILERYPESFVYFVDVKQTHRFRKVTSYIKSDNYIFLQENLHQLVLPEVDYLLSIHACGSLTDRVFSMNNKKAAVMTCCHTRELQNQYLGVEPQYLLYNLGLAGYVDRARATKLSNQGRKSRVVETCLSNANNVIISSPQTLPS